MSAYSAVRAAVLLFMVVLQLTCPTVNGYSVRYSAKTSTTGQMSFGLAGYCAAGDSGHTMMPKLQSYQTSAYAVMKENSFTKAPIGGESRQAACLDANCTWQFSHGLYFSNQLTFFFGVVYGSEGLRGGPVADVYNNFASGQPVWWSNVSYWGSRQPIMQADGTWANTNVVTYFTQWVCEYYEYHKSDASIFPTYPDGDVITPSSTSAFYHCGKKVERDSKGRWIYQRCNTPFPWWAGLIIAVVGLIVLVAIIIIVCCCCLYCDRNEERRDREEKLETMADNPAQVPTQTELGLSRHSSIFQGGNNNDDYESEEGSRSSR
jgi:hypothetical protein